MSDIPENENENDNKSNFHSSKNKLKSKKWIIICGLLGVCSGLLIYCFEIYHNAVDRMHTTSYFKQVSLATHNCADSYDQFPKPYHLGKEHNENQLPAMNDRLSVRVTLLQFIEQERLYNQFAHNEPWNSEINMPHSNIKITQYSDPSDPGNVKTSTRIFYNNGALWDTDPNKKTLFTDIPDGSSNTIMFVESTGKVQWTRFQDFEFDKSKALPPLGNPNREIFIASAADGSVRFFRKDMNPELIKQFIHASDGDNEQ